MICVCVCVCVQIGRIYIEGQTYDTDEHGEIAVPFSTYAGSKQIILNSGIYIYMYLLIYV